MAVGVNIGLGGVLLNACPAFDADASAEVEINELILGVDNLLNDCRNFFNE